jgi:hypothetical protein
MHNSGNDCESAWSYPRRQKTDYPRSSTRWDCQWEVLLRGFETTEAKCEAQTAWDVEERKLVVAPWQFACTHLAFCEGIPIMCPLFPTLPIHLTWPPAISACSLKWKLRLKGRRFSSIEEVQAESQQILNTLMPADFNECFQKWQNCWDCCIQAQCDYFESDGGN